jgi:hypothetical protein
MNEANPDKYKKLIWFLYLIAIYVIQWGRNNNNKTN